ncbi:MAG: SH3 domain-containing protein [Anaerolineales bacterium]|nr:SH3 domain-containing protein [Anaerolineales bacterium]
MTTTTGITTPVTAGTATPVAAGPATLQPNGVVPLAPFTNSLPVGPALTISDTVGVNVRSAPNTDGAILVVAPNGTVLPIVGRTADGAWYQVRLPDERIGWMAAAAIVASSDAGNAPVIGEGAPAPEATATETPVGPAVKATVSNELGSAVRSAPDQNLDPVVTLPVGTSLNAIGRTANNEWVQVALDDGTTAWARAATIALESDINTLPVTE